MDKLPYYKEVFGLISGVVLALIGLLSKRALFAKEEESEERLSADETARKYLSAPLEEFKGPIVNQYKMQIETLNEEIRILKKRASDDIEEHERTSSAMNKISAQVSRAIGQLSAVIESAEIAERKFITMRATANRSDLLEMIDESFRASERLNGVMSSLKRVERRQDSLVQDSDVLE